MERTLSQQLVDGIGRLRLADVPASVLEVAKLHALDAIGLGLASTRMDYGAAIHETGLALGRGDDSRVLGFGTRLPAASAALVNGTLIHGLDFDDTHIASIHHATAPVLAAALAVGEARHVSGEQLLLAYIVGLEVGCRIAGAGAGAFHARAFHPTGVAGAFAATCVAALLNDDPPEALVSSLGLCGSMASGILELRESWLKRMHPGWAAHSGIVAATMGRSGFRGPATVFEGTAGFFVSHIGTVPTATELGVDDLGSRWITAEIALKPYPCCHLIHAFVDASRQVLDELGRERLSADEVERIVCPTTAALHASITEPAALRTAPPTIYDALFSVQFVTATALAGRPIDFATFYESPLDDPAVLALASTVTCPADPQSDYPQHFPGEVEVHLADGRVVSRRVESSYGTPANPMSPEAVVAKFRGTAGAVLPGDQVDRVQDRLLRLEQVADIAELIDDCRA